ncbi:acetyl-CoA carboxylase biotin carboxylase subunit family protein [Streptomyces sp. NPDC091292]|uniref:ATP-grasp domain-containing protein n=1 Tax=Streptomyces sp. NPDC091292 TaxID=3365991 RepID=UPI003816004C
MLPNQRLYLLALNPTDSVTEGFLPAAHRLGLPVTLLTDRPDDHRERCPDGVDLRKCDVRDFRAVVRLISADAEPGAVFTNSDHLQTQAALAAAYFGLPAKSWRAALRTKDKALMRRHLASALPESDRVRSVEVPAGADPAAALGPVADLPYPCVVKPREGVASEDVVRVDEPGELVARCAEIQGRRPGEALVVEEFLEGGLHTLETLGDGRVLHVLGGFRTELSPPPYFIEERLTFVPAHPEPVVTQVLGQLAALGVGFGACHTEFVVDATGRARIVEVNYRAIGDQCDLLLADLLGIPLFAHILRVHLGEALPADLGARRGGAAVLDYPYARTSGTLTQAPGPVELAVGGVTLTYRPLRETGEWHELHHTNRDLLGVIRATGPDQGSVDRAVADFRATQRWEITP